MRTIIYQFKVKELLNEEFINAWKELTELIYKYENSLGSRLHKKDDQTYIAYAQWPDKYTMENLINLEIATCVGASHPDQLISGIPHVLSWNLLSV